jgi:hypothetical protein
MKISNYNYVNDLVTVQMYFKYSNSRRLIMIIQIKFNILIE